jgi:hypothetical protein
VVCIYHCNWAYDAQLDSNYEGEAVVTNSNYGTSVWILTVNSRYGTSVSAHATKKGAEETLKNWVTHMWDLSAGIPHDVNKAVKEYYEFFEGESYSLNYTKIGV